jgi:methionine synthase II (cobalamin-independent)
MINKKTIKKIFPVAAGALLGYAYYYFIGCNGSCPISGNPYVSTLYGALVGAVWLIPGKKMKKINKEILIEDLVNLLPESVTYLMEKGIRCLRCGEPIWGTLEEAAVEKGFDENQIDAFVEDLNEMLSKSDK